MSNVRKLREKPTLPKALVCGVLEDEGRVLFLVLNTEKLELPFVLVYTGMDPVNELKQAFNQQAGIECEIGDLLFEVRHNAGSRKRKKFVPCLVYRINARNRRAKPSKEFSGFKWISLDDAKKMKLGRKSEWLKKRLSN